jgi:Serine/threonine protein kinase
VDARLGGDGYSIEATLSGGMGDVWLLSRDNSPKDPRFAARVAVKTFHANLPEKQVINELGNWLELRHPCITPLLAIDYLNWHVAAVMPRMDGSLYDALRDNVFGAQKAAPIVRRILFALEHVWLKSGIYHLDIKPQNILWIGDPTNVKVADWGISRFVKPFPPVPQGTEASGSFTQASGTPGYMGPERFDPTWEMSAAADLYSLGLLACELVAGPFVSELIGTYGFSDAAVTRITGRATQIATQSAGPLGNFIRKCIAWDPAKRPTTFTDALALIPAL